MVEDLWRVVVSFPNYAISKNGIVKNITKNKILKRSFSNGYLHVGLYNEGKKINKKIHRLTASAWIDNPNNYPIIDHINKNKTDNRMENLRWCTQSINMRNRHIHSNNTSGIKGISFNNGYWICQYNDDVNKQINKYFSVSQYGENLAKTMAVEFRMQKERELNYL